MKLVKRLLETEGVRAALAWIAAGYIRITGATTHWETRLAPSSVALRDSGEPFLACFWHGRLMEMAAWNRHPRKFDIMISDHRDGLLIARAMRHMGYGVVAGYTSRHAAAALFATQQHLTDGGAIIITPDGPRGSMRWRSPRKRTRSGSRPNCGHRSRWFRSSCNGATGLRSTACSTGCSGAAPGGRARPATGRRFGTAIRASVRRSAWHRAVLRTN